MTRQASLCPGPHTMTPGHGRKGPKDACPSQPHKGTVSSWIRGGAVLGMAAKPELPLQG